jgi:hypothetical protein
VSGHPICEAIVMRGNLAEVVERDANDPNPQTDLVVGYMASIGMRLAMECTANRN